mmetsp:Transcript_1992/g.7198  ORF Transcript_1992/g.7198 Transcript_1992/m.7198 type:complete len:372 (+) Transcript_1992:30-1145(+)
MKRAKTKFGSIAVALEKCEVRQGSDVVGELIVTVDKPVEKVAAFRVALLGNVHSKVTRGSGKHQTTHFDDVEVCNEAKVMVPRRMERSADGMWGRLSVGEYRTPFTIKVPDYAVPSDRMNRGAKVQYILHCGLMRPYRGVWSALKSIVKPQYVCKLVIVFATPQPQRAAALVAPQTAQRSKAFTMSRSKGELSATVRVDQGYFYAGDRVQVHVKVENNSAKHVKRLSLQFVEYGIITAKGHTESFTKLVSQATVKEAIKKGETRTIEAIVQIPHDYRRVSFLTPVWEMRHGIRVIHRTSGLSFNMSVIAEVTILKRPPGVATSEAKDFADAPQEDYDNSYFDSCMATEPYADSMAAPPDYAVPEPSYAALL